MIRAALILALTAAAGHAATVNFVFDELLPSGRRKAHTTPLTTGHALFVDASGFPTSRAAAISDISGLQAALDAKATAAALTTEATARAAADALLAPLNGPAFTGEASFDQLSAQNIDAGDSAFGNITAGTIGGTTITASAGLAGPGSAITALNASALASGTVPDARLNTSTGGNGAADAGKLVKFGGGGGLNAATLGLAGNLTVGGDTLGTGSISSNNYLYAPGLYAGDFLQLQNLADPLNRATFPGSHLTGDWTIWVPNASGTLFTLESAQDGTLALDLLSVAGDGSGLTDLNASAVTTGAIPLARGGTGSGLTAPGADRLLFYDLSGGAVTWLTVGSGLALTGTTLTATGGALSGTGAVDNAILRADGTGGATLQNSALKIEDEIVGFAATGVASTDVITATGHNYADGTHVRFTALTGGSGLATGTNYWVRDTSGSTFKLAATSGGSAINFTTDISAATIVRSGAPTIAVSTNTAETNSALRLQPKGTGAFYFGAEADGATTGGNPRGARSVDLQLSRAAAANVVSGVDSFAAGANNTVSGQYAVAIGQGNTASQSNAFAGGTQNNASGNSATAFGSSNIASGQYALACGAANTASASQSVAFGFYSLANRQGQLSLANQRFAATGDAQAIHIVARRATTDATQSELTLDGASPTGTTITTSNRFILSASTTVTLDISVTARPSSGSCNASYKRRITAKRDGSNNSAIIGAVQTIGTDQEEDAAMDVTCDVDDTNDAIRVLVTGKAATNLRWVARIEGEEVSY